jgi:antitoxin component YwqK of YwqJK toxin-antitoxin module
MKKIIIIKICLLLLSCENNIKVKKEYYEDGKIKRTYYLNKNNEVDGKIYEYYKNGKIKLLRTMKSNKLHGVSKNYYFNGKLQSKCIYSNEKEIDTTYFFYETGYMKAIVIYDNKGNVLKETFFYSNGNLEKIRTYLIGSGEANSYKNFNKNGKVIDKFKYSKFATLSKKNSKLFIKLYGTQDKNSDSIILNILENFDLKYDSNYMQIFPKIKRKLIFFNQQSINLSIKNSDYSKEKLFIYIEEFKTKNGNPNALPFYIQLKKGQKIPKDNLHPMYIK